MTILDQTFWNTLYENGETRWDLGSVSPPIAAYIRQLPDKNIRILIPGCGNTHEAEYLLQQGFTNITVLDIAPLLVERIQKKFDGNKNIKIILGDFFEHQAIYDLIIEQTFFCAISPELRQQYAQKMHQLLDINGSLVGLLFNRIFENPGPPFGGDEATYQGIFSPYFHFKCFNACYNSYPARAGTELFINLIKKH